MFLKTVKRALFATFALAISSVCADNQTTTLSQIFSGEDLPFQVQIEQADFSLPNGIHSYALGIHKGVWLFVAGRTNGLHGFAPADNFPPSQQNTVVYVVDPVNKTTFSRSLTDPTSGLTQEQVDLLSVTSPQSYQSKKTLYMTGGYGVDSSTGDFSTKDVLSAINVPGLMHWVVDPSPGETAAQHIRQISNPIFQITGGDMYEGKDHITLLIFGQDFTGAYVDASDGTYSRQVRRFRIHDDGEKLSVRVYPPFPFVPDPSFRRRDLNVVPTVVFEKGKLTKKFVAYSGVFTPTTGIWTVPVEISDKGVTSMADPNLSSTFKQGMNNYVCPTLGLFSKKHKNMYTVIFGGISFGFWQNGVFQTDSEIPFINQVTTIQIDKHGNYTQYLMDAEYPVILSTQSNPGNQLLFGAGAFFIPADDLPTYNNGVVKMNSLGRDPILVGYIVGGIQSTLANTNVITDSAASPYIFNVIFTPNP